MTTTTAVPSDVTDPRLAGAGKLRIEWALTAEQAKYLNTWDEGT